jgi:quinolinate synthase
LSDISGSTQEIFDKVSKSEDNVIWVIGTETTFVNRIAATFPKKTILALKQSPCYDMMKINLRNTADIIKSVEDFITDKGALKNEVFVDNTLRKNAQIALNNMIKIVEERKP